MGGPFVPPFFIEKLEPQCGGLQILSPAWPCALRSAPIPKSTVVSMVIKKLQTAAVAAPWLGFGFFRSGFISALTVPSVLDGVLLRFLNSGRIEMRATHAKMSEFHAPRA